MQITIFGVGAMGSLYAAYFARAGHQVWAIDPWEAHIQVINATGLRVTGPHQTLQVRLTALTDPGGLPPGQSDVVIIATKSQHAELAARGALAAVAPGGVILTIQNGVGTAEKVASIVDPDMLLHGVVGGFAAKIVEPGHVQHLGWDRLRVGEFRSGRSARLEAHVDLWRSVGFNADAEEKLDRVIWEKLICNAAFSGICALTGLTVGQVMDDADVGALSNECARETYAVAQAVGADLTFPDGAAYAREHARKIASARTSMSADHAAGRPSEIDEINGAVVRLGASLGLSVPANAAVTQLIKGREKCLVGAVA